MAAFSLELSDGLRELREQLTIFAAAPEGAPAPQVAILASCVALLESRARTLECEVSRHRWNNAARVERAREMGRILTEATRPGSNVKLFPVIHRPILAGQPEGAA